jgi:hypothetical protein
MCFLESDREKELLDNARRAFDDCLTKVKAAEYNEALRTLLIGIDVLANLWARVDGRVTSEREAERNNRPRWIAFLRKEIPEWADHEMQWEGKTLRLDLSELSYEIRCKQTHEYSQLRSADFPVRLDWNHRLHTDPLMWVCGSPHCRKVDYVVLNGFSLLQRLVMVAQKYLSIFSSTPTRFSTCTCSPFIIYELLVSRPAGA